jgi:hypothetical protein
MIKKNQTNGIWDGIWDMGWELWDYGKWDEIMEYGMGYGMGWDGMWDFPNPINMGGKYTCN